VRSAPGRPSRAARTRGIWEGQGPRRERAQRAQAKPSTRARPEQAGGGQLRLVYGKVERYYERIIP